ncbi:DNA repair protein rhp41 [Cytospora mali]|uniref:DNA repair protein rhp41 n=1 Tax=Cytospora mali TaxID=578113 RepID=A0A194W184_CYTMA|nr:DNA repair protein rhp41 [Valsa mali]
MAGRRRGAGPATGVARRAEAAQRREQSSPPRTRSSARQSDAPVTGVYTQLLRESGALHNRMTSDEPERPLKRRRTGRRSPGRAPEVQVTSESPRSTAREGEATSDEDEEDVEFEDVEIPEPTIQTTYRESSDEESEDDVQFEDVDIGAILSNEDHAEEKNVTLELNLTAAKEALAPSRRNADRRKPISKEEKECRFHIHKVHLLCLLAHAEKRNHWCNDPVVQQTLRPLLTAKIIQWLNPGSNLTQFSQTESLKKGLQMTMERFQQRFSITERGLRRSLWAEDEKQLEDYELPDDIDSCLEMVDFRKAAKSFNGSRDVGAQLFCALLRAAGVEVRLVVSLQPLSFVPGGPTLPKRRQPKTPSRPAPARVEAVQAVPSPSTPIPTPRSRLGHPNATAYHIPDISAVPSSSSPRFAPRQPQLPESDYPVYWVEVLDAAHQKWQPVDPFVPGTLFRAAKFEPPASDRGNCLSYVVGFEESGAAKDVTRRYTKAFNAKTRRMRIDGPMVPEEGKKWWRRVLKRYRVPGLITDLDQIENNELSGLEAREPLPRNVVDFKNHPIYALQRHLRRHEVLVPGASVVGTVGAGSKGLLEKIYRRKDVRVARSADKWYRLGREIKPGEEPVKVLPKRKRPQRRGRLAFDEEDESSDDDPVLGPSPAKGVPIFTFDQTQLYVPPPVVAGRIPKNRFGNLDTYVPSMVPAGGAHIVHPRAGRAAHLLGIDYAPALTGFDWKGRKGTAVYSGVVVPSEAEEGVRAVIGGFEDLELMMEEERRSLRALATWKRLLRGLRIRKSVFADEDMFDESIPLEDIAIDEDRDGMGDAESGWGAGRFEPDYDQAGGFEPEGLVPGGFEPGGFEPGGFETGGFEPGGFELDAIEETAKGKGKQPETYDLDRHDVQESEGLGSPRRRRARRARVLESDEEDEDEEPAASAPVDAGQPEDLQAHHDGSMPEVRGFKADHHEDNQPQPMEGTSEPIANPVNNELEANAQPSNPDSVRAPVGTEQELGQPETSLSDAESKVSRDRDSADSQSHDSKTQNRGTRAGSGDAELEDADSDTTEELYMDEDGSLVE